MYNCVVLEYKHILSENVKGLVLWTDRYFVDNKCIVIATLTWSAGADRINSIRINQWNINVRDQRGPEESQWQWDRSG